MRLKKLIIHGFKSFADKTVMEFQPGVTAIVGPNGCGKSNVVDALRWVMGETQAKAIRGEKMNDILFNGTKTRAKTSYAEVSLVFDDIQAALPVPYEEVMVTRRLFSDGVSGYYLNKKEVRLKDLHTLFANTGIGKNAFWVFEQGKIDQIVTMSPTELRTIFEDAAGISLYLFQKKEAKARFKEIEQNLLRAKDRLGEKEKFIALLRKQKEDARLWSTAKNELEIHEKGFFYKRLIHLDGKIGEIKKQQQESIEECSFKEKNLAEKRELLKAEEENLSQKNSAKNLHTEKVFQGRGEIHLLENQLKNLHVQINEKKGRQHSLESTLKTFAENLGEFEKKNPLDSKKLEELEIEVTHLQSRLKAEKKELESLELALQQENANERRLNDSFHLHQKAHQKFQFDLKALDLKKENSQKEIQENSETLTRLKHSIGVSTVKKSSLQEDYNLLKTVFEDLKIELKIKSEQLQKIENESRLLDQNIYSIVKKETELQTKINSLNSLKSALEESSQGTKELIKLSKDPASPLFKKLTPLSEILDVDPECAEAIACALHPHTHTLVTESDDDLQQALDVVKEKQLTNISLISKSAFKDQEIVAESLASSCLPKEVSAHFFNDALYSNNLLPRTWSKEGYWVTEKRLITKTKMGEHNAFMRQGEIKKLLTEKNSCSSKKCELELEKSTLLKEKEQFLTLLKNHEALLKQKEIKLMELKFHLQNETESCKKEQERAKSIEEKLYSMIEWTKNIEIEGEDLLKKVIQHQSEATIAYQSLESIKGVLEKHQEATALKKIGLQALEKNLFEKLSQKEKLSNELTSIYSSHQQQIKQQERLEKELQDLIPLIKELETELKRIEKSLDESIKIQKELENQLIILESTFKELAAKLKTHKETLEKESQLLNLSKDHLRNFEMRLFVEETKQKTLLEELYEKYSLTLSALEKPHEELSFEKYELKIKDLKNTLSSMPSINPLAEEEYEEEEKGLNDLKREIGDLEAATLEVQKLISELDKKSHAQFRETFSLVAENFKQNFIKLFNGGHAELLFEEAPDLLEAKVEIRCEPPGKSLKSLQLLSGGEKCLTAIALLFALFQVKPSPMCLLDEIDAPLDEANAKRFLDLITPFSHQTKIILVTHNKLTMEKAHQLIGISMQEKGITKVLELQQTLILNSN